MDSQRLNDLVAQAKEGTLSRQASAEVAQALAVGADDQTYKMLYVLARSGAREYEGVLASYLDYRDDPQVSALALSSLCTHWHLAARYRHMILEGITGLEWDSLNEVKTAAISSAGEYLRLADDCEVLRALIGVAEGEPDDLMTRFGVEALARSLGEQHQTSIFPRDREFGSAWAHDTLARAKARCERDCGSKQT